MNRPNTRHIHRAGTFAAAVLTSFVLFACAATPSSPPGSAEVRNKLTALQNDANLAGRARVEIQEAEEAVRLAEQPLPSSEGPLGEHRVYMADRKIEIARAKGNTSYAEDQRAQFAEEREAARLAARTQEADRARDDADHARADANRARDDASQARYDANRSSDDADQARYDASRSSADASRARDDANQARSAADAARSAEAQSAADAEAARRAAAAARSAEAESNANAADAARQAAELQRQIDVLEAETTDRGLVLTLGDVLFTTGSASLQNGASTRLNRLVAFLNHYPDRRVLIEGHTDNVGNATYNQGLSQRRAESVESYLTQQGIGSQRLAASGMGLNQPIASNDSAAGRQQNRRVEIIIENPPLVSSGESQP